MRKPDGREYFVNGIARINGDNSVALRFTSQPGGQTRVEGARATFVADVTGYPAPALQWEFEGTEILGATNSTLVLSDVLASQSGSYLLVASNAFETVASEPAVLTVLVPPRFTEQPQPQQVPLGGTASFAVGNGVDYRVHALAIQPDGRILAGGEFSNIAGATRNSIARLNPNGSLDTSFDPQSGPDGAVLTMAYQADGRIVIGGLFTEYDGVPRRRVARLLSDGTLDMSFDTSDGPNGDVQSLVIQPDGRVVIGGRFTMVNGVARARIARLNGNIEPPEAPIILTQPGSTEAASGSRIAFSVEARGTLPLSYLWFKDGTNILGATAATIEIASVQPADSGAYCVTVTNLAGAVWSQPAALVVDGRPVVVKQPADAEVQAGAGVQFTVEAIGPGELTFAWSHDGILVLDGPGVSGATTTALRLEQVGFSAGGNYSVRVTSPFGSATSRTAKLRVLAANDDFADAVTLQTLGGQAIDDNHRATKEPGEPPHAGDEGGRSIWFKWVPGATGWAVLDTWGSPFDTLLAVYQGATLTALGPVAANDDGVGYAGNSLVTFWAEAAEVYWIAVDGYRGSSGQVVLHYAFEAPVFGSIATSEKGVQLQLNARDHTAVVIESSQDLRLWLPVATNMVGDAGLLRWMEPWSPGAAPRFYRALTP